jgi:hypothetical protein
MNFQQTNARFEEWLENRCLVIGCGLVKEDLKQKHHCMKKSAFVFLRATSFLWAKIIEDQELCFDLSNAPRMLSIGDAHVENFGSWRDDEGRLVLGCDRFRSRSGGEGVLYARQRRSCRRHGIGPMARPMPRLASPNSRRYRREPRPLHGRDRRVYRPTSRSRQSESRANRTLTFILASSSTSLAQHHGRHWEMLH